MCLPHCLGSSKILTQRSPVCERGGGRYRQKQNIIRKEDVQKINDLICCNRTHSSLSHSFHSSNPPVMKPSLITITVTLYEKYTHTLCLSLKAFWVY